MNIHLQKNSSLEQGDQTGLNFITLGYSLKAQVNFQQEIWFVLGIARVQKGVDVDVLDFRIEL